MVEARILIADDSKMNQQILSEILGGRYEYLYADDGMQALELLLDINMLRLDGFSVLEVMRQRNWLQEIPVIITSSEGWFSSGGYRLDSSRPTILAMICSLVMLATSHLPM